METKPMETETPKMVKLEIRDAVLAVRMRTLRDTEEMPFSVQAKQALRMWFAHLDKERKKREERSE